MFYIKEAKDLKARVLSSLFMGGGKTAHTTMFIQLGRFCDRNKELRTDNVTIEWEKIQDNWEDFVKESWVDFCRVFFDKGSNDATIELSMAIMIAVHWNERNIKI